MAFISFIKVSKSMQWKGTRLSSCILLSTIVSVLKTLFIIYIFIIYIIRIIILDFFGLHTFETIERLATSYINISPKEHLYWPRI